MRDIVKQLAKQTVAVCIYNAVVVIAFAVLAYLFHKWWIVLFSTLALYTVKFKTDDEE